MIIPVDGLTHLFSWIKCLLWVLFTCESKPFLRCRSDVRLWHCCILLSFQALYVMSLRRPTAACTVFTFCYKSFMWCRPDARLWHYCSAFSARGVFQTLAWHLYYYSAFSSRGVFQTLVWHLYFTLNYFNQMCASWFSYLFVTDVWLHNNPEHVLNLLYPCS